MQLYHLYYNEAYAQRNGYAVYYSNGDLKQTIKVTHAYKEKLPCDNDGFLYLGLGRYGWSHRIPFIKD